MVPLFAIWLPVLQDPFYWSRCLQYGCRCSNLRSVRACRLCMESSSHGVKFTVLECKRPHHALRALARDKRFNLSLEHVGHEA